MRHEIEFSLHIRCVFRERRDLALTSGRGSRDKVVALTGLTHEDADARLAAAVKGAAA